MNMVRRTFQQRPSPVDDSYGGEEGGEEGGVDDSSGPGGSSASGRERDAGQVSPKH